MAWDYQREEREFEQVPEGSYRIRVKSAEKAVSKKGNDMLVLCFDVSGCDIPLYHYITFMLDNPQITNRNLTSFFDGFAEIKEGDFNMNNWIGKIGACVVRKDKNDPDKTRISYFLKAGSNRVNDLPAWVEPKNSDGGYSNLNNYGSDDDYDVPFT